MTRQVAKIKKNSFFWMIRISEVNNLKNGWVDKSMAQKHILKECVYYALKILHVFLDVLSCFMSSEFNPFVISECQELLLLFQLKPWGDGKQHFSCSDQYFFSLSTCQSCDYSTEKLIECKWDNTNSCCVQTLILCKIFCWG